MEGYTFWKPQYESQISVDSSSHKTTQVNNGHLTKPVCFKECAKSFICSQCFLLRFYSVFSHWVWFGTALECVIILQVSNRSSKPSAHICLNFGQTVYLCVRCHLDNWLACRILPLFSTGLGPSIIRSNKLFWCICLRRYFVFIFTEKQVDSFLCLRSWR